MSQNLTAGLIIDKPFSSFFPAAPTKWWLVGRSGIKRILINITLKSNALTRLLCNLMNYFLIVWRISSIPIQRINKTTLTTQQPAWKRSIILKKLPQPLLWKNSYKIQLFSKGVLQYTSILHCKDLPIHQLTAINNRCVVTCLSPSESTNKQTKSVCAQVWDFESHVFVVGIDYSIFSHLAWSVMLWSKCGGEKP